MDRFNKLAADRLRERLMQKSAAKPVYRVPAPAPKPVYSVPTPTRPSPAVIRALPQPTQPRAVYTPPPPPTVAQRAANNITKLRAPVPTSRAGTGTRTDSPTLVGQETQPESLIWWQSPDGTDVVAPEGYTPPEGWTQESVITDPEAVENARNSTMYWDNQSEDVQALFTVPDQRPIFNNGQTPLWMADDAARREQEQRDEQAGQEHVAQQMARHYAKMRNTRSVSMASDQARRDEEEESARQSAPVSLAAAERLRQKMANTNAIDISTDFARTEDEETSARQVAERRARLQERAAIAAAQAAAAIVQGQEQAAEPDPVQLGTPEGYIWVSTPDNPQPHLHPADQNIPAGGEMVDPPMSNEVSAYDLGIALGSAAAAEPDRIQQAAAFARIQEQAADDQASLARQQETIGTQWDTIDEQQGSMVPDTEGVTFQDGHYYPEGTDTATLFYNGPQDHNLPDAPAGWVWTLSPTERAQGVTPYLVPVNNAIPLEGTGAEDPPTAWESIQDRAIDPVLDPALDYGKAIYESVRDGYKEVFADLRENPLDILNPLELTQTMFREVILPLVPKLIPDAAEEWVGETARDLLEGGAEAWEAAKRGEFGDAAAAVTRWVDAALTTELPLSELTDGRVEDASILDILSFTLNRPQEYTVQQTIDQWYGTQTGTDQTDGILEHLATIWGNSVIGFTTMPDWLAENTDLAIQVYEQGIDSDGDGAVDMTGADAVAWTYRQEAGAWNAFVFDTITDPYNALIVTGGAGSVIRGAGTSLRGLSRGGRLATGAGRVLEATGTGIERGSRILEAAGDLGLGYAPGLARRVGRNLPGVFGETNAFKRVSQLEDVTAATENASRALRRVEGEDAVFTRTPDGGADVTLPGRADPVHLDPDHATDLERELDPTIDPSPATQAAMEDLAAAGIDPTVVPRRFVEPINAIIKLNPAMVREIAESVTRLVPDMRTHVIRMDAGFSRGRSFPDAAIDSSGWVRDTFRPAFPEGTQFPPYRHSTPRQSSTHIDAETIIHAPWTDAVNRDARARLYRNVGANDSWQRRLPDAPTDVQIARAERYMAMVDEHARWHPEVLDDQDFARYLNDADAIRTKLADLGVEPRKRYELRISPKRTDSFTPRPATPEGTVVYPQPDPVAPAQPATPTDGSVPYNPTPDELPLDSPGYEPPVPGDPVPDPGTTVTPLPVEPVTPAPLPEPDPAPTRVTPLDAAVADGLLEAPDILDAFRRLYHWSDTDIDLLVRDLRTIRDATGARTITRAEVFTPTGRRWINDLNSLLDARKTATRHADVVNRSPAGSKVRKEAEALERKARSRVAEAERRLGIADTGTGRKRIAKDGSIVPPEMSKAAKAYADEVAKLTSAEYTSRTRWHARNMERTGLVADEGGMAWVATPWGDMPLTQEDLAQLTRHTFTDGTTTLDRWVRNINAKAGDPRLTPDEAIEAARRQTLDELHNRLDELYPSKHASKLGKLWDTYTAYLRNSILGTIFNAPRYIGTTIMGNTLNLTLGGYGTRAWRMARLDSIYRNGEITRTLARTLDADLGDPYRMLSERTAEAWGIANVPEIERQFRTDAIISSRTNTDRFFDKRLEPRWFDPMIRAGEQGPAALRKEGMTQLTRAGRTADRATEILDEFFVRYPNGYKPGDIARFFEKHLPTHARATTTLARKGIQNILTGDPTYLRFAQGADMQMRDIVFDTAFRRDLKAATLDFQQAAGTRLRAQGFTDAEAADILREFHAQHRTFTQRDVQEFFDDYVPAGIADRLGRDWQSSLNRARNTGRQEVARVALAGKETNFDAFMRRWTMFSYFFSRQYLYIITQALRHPGLINAYLNYQDFVDRYLEENPDMPRWARGFLRMSSGDMFIYFNPMTILAMGNLFPDVDGLAPPPDGMIWIQASGEEPRLHDADEPIPDGWFEVNSDSWFQHYILESPWFMVHPGINAVLNATGFTGDQRDLDPFNTHTLGRYIQFTENVLRKTGLIEDADLAGNRSDDFWNNARDFFSSKTDWLPGAEHVEFIESAESENAELRAIAWDEAERMGLDPENNVAHRAWLDAEMSDPDSEMYHRAMKRYLLGEATNLGLKMVPGIASTRPMVRPKSGDGLDLMEKLKDTEEMKQFVRSPNRQARDMQNQMDAFYDLDTSSPENRAGAVLQDMYVDIVFGEPDFDIVIDGVTYTPADIAAMSEDERKDLALAYFATLELGYSGESGLNAWQAYKEQQDQFLADPANAEFAQYRSWSTGVRDYPGGVEGYWQAVILHNPNARRYFESLDPNMSEAERERALTGTWAFFAVAGIQPNIYQPEPLETNFFDPIDVANKAPQPIPYEPYVSDWEKDTTAQVTKYEREMKRAEPIMRGIMVQWGIDPSLTFNQLPYRTRMSLLDEYERQTGKSYPWEEADGYYLANLYFQWADQQPEGSDTSLDAYFAENDEQWEEGMPALFNQDQQAAEDDRTAWDLYDENRNKDPGFRYEDED